MLYNNNQINKYFIIALMLFILLSPHHALSQGFDPIIEGVDAVNDGISKVYEKIKILILSIAGIALVVVAALAAVAYTRGNREDMTQLAKIGLGIFIFFGLVYIIEQAYGILN